jgi:1-acyl-sn-glycerol-3-phosphate acyltransferase
VLFGVYTYLEFFLLAVLFAPLLALIAWIHRADPVCRIRGRWMRRFGRWTSRLTPLWRFSVEGKPPADIGRSAYVVVSNHQSTADPFLLSWLPWDMRWVAKVELFRLPLIGWLLRSGGDIPLRRGDGISVARMFKACGDTLRRGMPVMIFPEGTRSTSDTVQPFKDGAFELAIRHQVPVLPVALSGTRNCRPKGSLWFGDADAVARVLEPIPTAGMEMHDLAQLRDLARSRIADAAAELAQTRSGPRSDALESLAQRASGAA